VLSSNRYFPKNAITEAILRLLADDKTAAAIRIQKKCYIWRFFKACEISQKNAITEAILRLLADDKTAAYYSYVRILAARQTPKEPR